MDPKMTYPDTIQPFQSQALEALEIAEQTVQLFANPPSDSVNKQHLSWIIDNSSENLSTVFDVLRAVQNLPMPVSSSFRIHQRIIETTLNFTRDLKGTWAKFVIYTNLTST